MDGGGSSITLTPSAIGRSVIFPVRPVRPLTTQACKLRGWKVAKKGDAYDVMISDYKQSIKALMRMRTHPR